MVPKYIVSESESEAEGTVPSDHTLDKALRQEVEEKYRAKNFEELTVKRVRRAVEEKLGLELGFFRDTGDWKAKSEEIIKDEFDILRTSAPEPLLEAEAEPAGSTSSHPPDPIQGITAKRHKTVSVPPKPRKRQKTQAQVPDEEAELSEPSDGRVEEGPKPVKGAKGGEKATPSKKTKEPSPEASEAEDVENQTTEVTKDDSETEMSIVFDEEPRGKPVRKRKSGDGGTKKAGSKKGAAKGKDEDLDPDQAEIKRLQGWLVKCGIRKMWWRELQPYETSKAKIKHLKQMLEDAGMKGRYSLEKARKIREEREFKADLEQIQQGAKKWGTGSGDEGSDGPASSRRAARGRQALAFLDSDGEETD